MTNDAKPEDKLYDKVAALLRKAESTTAEEAEALLAKAEELIAKHQLDDLRARSLAGYAGPPDEMGREFIEFKFKTQYKEDATLLHCIAKPNGCKVVTTQKVLPKDGRYVEVKGAYLFGRESNRKHVMWMYSSMLVTVTRLQNSAGSTWPQRRSFRIGFADGICRRLESVKQSAVRVAETESGGSLLPVLASEAAEIERHITESLGRTRVARTTAVDPFAYRAGKAAADRVDVGGTRLPGQRRGIGAGS